MGIALSLYAVFQLGKISVGTLADAARGPVPREATDARTRAFARKVVDRARLRLEVRGADAVPRDRPLVYMSNHQSHLDIPVLYATMPSPTVRMVAKAELFKVPVWGPAMRAAGMIEVDRQRRERATASLHAAGEQLAAGVCIWIAPEGTRSRTGAIGRLKKGGFYLAKETGTAILPVAISGTRDALPARAVAIKPGARVRVVFGAPIEVAGRSVPELMREVEAFFRSQVPRPTT
jgi:1-acyl-sn-glycerol-3-phosphate acyltransferase